MTPTNMAQKEPVAPKLDRHLTIVLIALLLLLTLLAAVPFIASFNLPGFSDAVEARGPSQAVTDNLVNANSENGLPVSSLATVTPTPTTTGLPVSTIETFVDQPTATNTATATETATTIPPTATTTPSPTYTVSPTETPTNLPTLAPTFTPTPSATATNTPIPTPTRTPIPQSLPVPFIENAGRDAPESDSDTRVLQWQWVGQPNPLPENWYFMVQFVDVWDFNRPYWLEKIGNERNGTIQREGDRFTYRWHILSLPSDPRGCQPFWRVAVAMDDSICQQGIPEGNICRLTEYSEIQSVGTRNPKVACGGGKKDDDPEDSGPVIIFE